MLFNLKCKGCSNEAQDNKDFCKECETRNNNRKVK